MEEYPVLIQKWRLLPDSWVNNGLYPRGGVICYLVLSFTPSNGSIYPQECHLQQGLPSPCTVKSVHLPAHLSCFVSSSLLEQNVFNLTLWVLMITMYLKFSIGYANICSSEQDHRQKFSVSLKHRFGKNKWEQWNQQEGSLKHLKKRGYEEKCSWSADVIRSTFHQKFWRSSEAERIKASQKPVQRIQITPIIAED